MHWTMQCESKYSESKAYLKIPTKTRNQTKKMIKKLSHKTKVKLLIYRNYFLSMQRLLLVEWLAIPIR